MTEFAYIDAKNTSIDYMSFEPNCRYHPHVSFENETNLYSKFCLANKIAKELKELMSICQQNLFHTQIF